MTNKKIVMMEMPQNRTFNMLAKINFGGFPAVGLYRYMLHVPAANQRRQQSHSGSSFLHQLTKVQMQKEREY